MFITFWLGTTREGTLGRHRRRWEVSNNIAFTETGVKMCDLNRPAKVYFKG
jgi:hypothetical protein